MSSFQPRVLYTAAQSRAVDKAAIERHGLPGPLLMARAARAAFGCLQVLHPEPTLLQVLCGAGNNGGDGLLMAMLAHARGIPTRVLLVDGEPRSADARAALARARDVGVQIADFEHASLASDGVIVDAILGTGARGALRDSGRRAIEAVNASGSPVLSLDLPSGIDSDSGAALVTDSDAATGCAVRATWTLSFITAKRGMYTGVGAECVGERFVDDLEVPGEAYTAAGAGCEVLQLEQELRSLPKRPLGAHKGSFGRCLLVGGDRGMGGAIMLAAEAALRCGVGLAQVATRGDNLAPLLARLPECLAHAVEHRNALEPLLDAADAIVIGPGLGQDAWGEQMLHACLAAGKPLLLDADALNLLSRRTDRPWPREVVITPHPGEAGRLLGCASSLVQADRFAAAQKLAAECGGSVVLKGSGSVVQSGTQVSLCTAGNPGMASGGMGDVLSGVIGALLAQGLAADAAARLGTVLHAHAADLAAANIGQPALLASDLVPMIVRLLK